MIKKQIRNNLVSCLSSELINGFPPYVLGGFPVREFSICEVMDDVNKNVVAVYKLHNEQWYRYDLISVFPPYPPQPEPLQRTISLGLIVPAIPIFPSEGNPLYQNWDNYPDSPLLTSPNHNYQIITSFNGLPDERFLHLATNKFYMVNGINTITNSGAWTTYRLVGGIWEYHSINSSWQTGGTIDIFIEANNDVYTDSSLTTVYFAKTTTDSIDNPKLTLISVTPVTASKVVTVPTIPTITESTL